MRATRHSGSLRGRKDVTRKREPGEFGNQNAEVSSTCALAADRRDYVSRHASRDVIERRTDLRERRPGGRAMIEYQITMDNRADRATAPLTIAFMPPQIGAGERVVYGIWSSPSHDLARSPSGPFYLRKWYGVEERIRNVGPGGARAPRVV